MGKRSHNAEEEEDLDASTMSEQKDFSLRDMNYYVAEALGVGAYGAVRTVYDDNGEVFALKAFDDEEDEEEQEEDDEDEEGEGGASGADGTMDLGVLREISVLRLLNKIRDDDVYGGHPNLMELRDVVNKDGQWAMVMRKYECSLQKALETKCLNNAQKVTIAHGLLVSVAFLHANGCLHRDIKPDNVLLTGDSMDRPVLADYSLARPYDMANPNGTCDADGEPTHSSECFTCAYRSPEVVAAEMYGCPADVWAVGIVLMEMFDAPMRVDRDKAAIAHAATIREKLSGDKPLPTLLRGLLDPEPSTRLTAAQALKSPIFDKLNAKTDSSLTAMVPELAARFQGVAVDMVTGDKENAAGAGNKQVAKKAKKASKYDSNTVDGQLNKLYNKFGFKEARTLSAASKYASKCETVEPLHCLLMASKMYERELMHIADAADTVESFDIDTYHHDERTIFQAMDFCLY